MNSDYDVRLATLGAMGGDTTKDYASVYDIDLEILNLSANIITQLADLDARVTALEPHAGPPSDEIWYTTSNGQPISDYDTTALPTVISNTYSDGKGILKFAEPLTSIGVNAFVNCSNMLSVNIPYTVNNIGGDAFALTNSENITNIDITLNTTTPPTIESYAFGDVNDYRKVYIYVPEVAYDTYYNNPDENWEFYQYNIVNPNEQP